MVDSISRFMVHDIKFWTHVTDEKAYACERYSPEKEQGRRSLEATPLLSSFLENVSKVVQKKKKKITLKFCVF